MLLQQLINQKKMNTTKFSVIIPIYNVEKYLKECIDSVLRQSFNDYELILVDDGSTDSSGMICDDYAKSNNKISVIHKPNGGQSDARNVGLQQAKGEYICFIDSDDYWCEDSVLETLNDKTQRAADVILFKFKKYFESSGQFAPCSFSIEIPLHITDSTEKMLCLIDKDAYNNSPCSKSIKHSVLTGNNIEFEKGLLGEDIDWYYKVVVKAKSYEVIDTVFMIYRQRSDSTTKSATIKNIKDLLWIIEKWSGVVADGIKEERVYEVIRANLAKQYCNLLIGYASLRDKRKIEYLGRIQRLSYLLRYSKNKRVRYFRLAASLVGLKGVFAIVCLIRKYH